jgi:large subunit ribosomal protein L3
MMRHLHEFRYEGLPTLNVGDVLKADVFVEGEMVDVAQAPQRDVASQGGVKRLWLCWWPQNAWPVGSPIARPGSRGAGTTPGHTIPRYARSLVTVWRCQQSTVQNLKVALVDAGAQSDRRAWGYPRLHAAALVVVREAVKQLRQEEEGRVRRTGLKQ